MAREIHPYGEEINLGGVFKEEMIKFMKKIFGIVRRALVGCKTEVDENDGRIDLQFFYEGIVFLIGYLECMNDQSLEELNENLRELSNFLEKKVDSDEGVSINYKTVRNSVDARFDNIQSQQTIDEFLKYLEKFILRFTRYKVEKNVFSDLHTLDEEDKKVLFEKYEVFIESAIKLIFKFVHS